MISKFWKKWSYLDSVAHCFKNAPRIKLIKKDNPNLDLSKVKASEQCKRAINLFKQYSPSDTSLDGEMVSCNYPERTALQWFCMATFASHQNSFQFSASQCFPHPGLHSLPY